ncbi:MAG: Ig-like domain repeat protein, partial [Terracidiphilus sp.]
MSSNRVVQTAATGKVTVKPCAAVPEPLNRDSFSLKKEPRTAFFSKLGEDGNSGHFGGPQLLFATPLFESCCSAYGVNAVSQNGVAVDSNGNIYAAGYGNDAGKLVTTPGTYATPGAGPGWRGYFAKISPVLPETSTTLTIAPATAYAGQNVTFTATVAGTTQTTPAPTGTVTLYNQNTSPATELGTITLGSNGSGSFSTTTLAAGSYSVTASYSGDSNYDVSVSAPQTLTVTAQVTQTITFANPGTQTVGTRLTLTATASSGLAVGFASLTKSVCTVSGAKAALVAAGTCTIQASRPGNTVYSAAPNVNQSFAVNREAQTITFKQPLSPVTFGVKPIALSATAGSKLAVTFSIVSGPAKVSGTNDATLTITGAGTVVVTAKQPGNADYSAAPELTRTIKVNKAAQTITFKPPASPVTYGVKPIALSA